MSGTLRSTVAAAFGLLLAGTAGAQVGPQAIINVSQELLRIYNARDGAALHGLLAPSLQTKYAVEDLRLILAYCHGLTHEIERFSLPSWGTRRYGFFGVYAENAVLEMILEIDENERVLHWVITDDVTARDQQCSLGDAS